MARKDEVAEIVQAAQVIEQELERLEGLARSVQKARLDSDKNIARAGRILEEAVQQQEQLGVSLRKLGESMGRMQLRQQTAVEAIAARAQDVQRQATLLTAHVERFAALGVKAAEATRMLQAPPSADDAVGAARDAAAAPATATLIDVEARLHALSDEAKALARSAQAAELTDISKDVESLRQRLESARSRLSELVREAQQRAN
jgi:hypothetical protein